MAATSLTSTQINAIEFYDPVKYNGHTYNIMKNRGDYTLADGDAICKSKNNSYMAELADNPEFLFLNDHLKNLSSSFPFWRLGLNDAEKEGEFKNYRSGTDGYKEEFDWCPYQPSDWKNDEDCMCIYTTWYSGCLDDVRCANESAFICEGDY